MRHRISRKGFSRSPAHRKAMFRNLAKSLITHEAIRTTETKAKELRRVMDKLITMALKNDLHARRRAYKVLGSHGLVKRLFDEIGPRYAGGQGGYTRVIKLAYARTGDAAPMALIELTKREGAEEPKPDKKKAAKAAPAKSEAPKAEATKAKAEKPKKEEAKPEEPKAEEAAPEAVEEPKAEEAKAEEPEAPAEPEEAKAEEPAAEEPKSEAAEPEAEADEKAKPEKGE